ncbi:STAS domain-containing protein [Maribius pontilimi]|uniref:Anti-sigma factor antagonist n=1 Tax=Palleronia pontilimi TaxID=1964209 RepID=A0A934MCT0_9RHOB|nr:STAS domain-containing protein [Palleronia pontilimi]MBJ3763128.1 STAS domain-containing protein [Palleronia pontilimi]
MQIETTRTGSALIIRILSARVDAAEAVRFKDVIRDAALDGPDRVILDMGAVTFLDSSGLGAVIGTMKQLMPDQQLELANLTPAVSKVFRLTRMDSVMPIHDALPPCDAARNGAVGQAHAV